MKSILKSTCAFILSLCLVVTFMPTTVFAVTGTAEDDPAVVTEAPETVPAETDEAVEPEEETTVPEEIILEPVSDEEMEEVLAESSEEAAEEPAPVKVEESAPAEEESPLPTAKVKAAAPLKAAGDGYTSAIALTVDGAQVSGTLYKANGTAQKWYQFTTSEAAFYDVTIWNSSTSGSVTATLYDANVAKYTTGHDNQAFASSNSSNTCSNKLPANTKFYINLEGSYNKSVNYSIQVKKTVDTGSEDASSSASTLSLGTAYSRACETSYDVDWYKFKTDSVRSFYKVTLANKNAEGSIRFELLDSNLTSMNYNSSYTNRTESYTEKLASGKYYYVKVGQEYGNAGKYALSITQIKDADAGDAYNDSKAVSIKTVYSGKINVEKDQDWYKFVAPAKGTFRVRFNNKKTSANAYVYVTAYNSSVTQVGDEVFVDAGKSKTIDLKASAKGKVFYIQVRNDYKTPTYSFSIGRVATASKATLSKSSYTYNGKSHKPTVTVKFNGVKLVKGTDYTLSYSNTVKVGTATVTINFKGKYAGSKKVRYTIKPRKTSFTSASGKHKMLHMFWSKRAEADYYQIQYSRYSSFKNAKSDTYHITEWYSPTLKTGYYYVRIRTGKDIYQSYDGKTHHYRSGWSKVKKVYVKK